MRQPAKHVPCTWCGEECKPGDIVDGAGRCVECTPDDTEECEECGDKTENGPTYPGRVYLCTVCLLTQRAEYMKEND